ncbi:ABC transporter permease [uncultured Ottowia sp.]|uniref:ABC transporter permease n=1 Tax=uncultured Ottowia sp. TaxID=543067 RepID=UPI0025953E74|nr:ABC transporter permease [uncultured Ottowia sp.]
MPPTLLAGGALTLLALLAALLSLVWLPWPIDAVDMNHKLLPPSAAHWLGTDAYGRDVAALLLAGARASLAAAALAVALGLAAGAALGLLAAALRGWVEQAIMRVADFAFAFPAILTAIMLAAIRGPGLGVVVLAVGIYGIPAFARVTHAAASQAWAREYTRAARALGLGPWAITWRHVLPNIAAPLTVQATSRFATAVLAEAALSYLGLGVQPPQPSWGRMLAEAQSLMFDAPLLAVWPGLAIALTVLGLNLLGDGLRDALDPRSQTRPA